MFKGLPSGVVVGLLGVVLDMVAVLVMEVKSGVRGVSGVRSAVLLFNVCLLNVLNACMLFLMVRTEMANLGSDEMFLY